MYQGISKNIFNKINSNLNSKTTTVSFLEAPNPRGDNYIDVKQNAPEWHKIRKSKVTGSRLRSVLGFSGK